MPRVFRFQYFGVYNLFDELVFDSVLVCSLSDIKAVCFDKKTRYSLKYKGRGINKNMHRSVLWGVLEKRTPARTIDALADGS